jgi:hypothetical protein
MTKKQAEEYVRDHSDDDEMDDADLAEVFAALYDRQPDQQDYDDGLWSLCCAAAL